MAPGIIDCCNLLVFVPIICVYMDKSANDLVDVTQGHVYRDRIQIHDTFTLS